MELRIYLLESTDGDGGITRRSQRWEGREVPDGDVVSVRQVVEVQGGSGFREGRT